MRPGLQCPELGMVAGMQGSEVLLLQAQKLAATEGHFLVLFLFHAGVKT